ncbi:hypothetical protein Mapa_003771 [Marchantia paleacea]|nr:hypothetical protein Mapa_003771 [Marchantia paleacea]
MHNVQSMHCSSSLYGLFQIVLGINKSAQSSISRSSTHHRLLGYLSPGWIKCHIADDNVYHSDPASSFQVECSSLRIKRKFPEKRHPTNKQRPPLPSPRLERSDPSTLQSWRSTPK